MVAQAEVDALIRLVSHGDGMYGEVDTATLIALRILEAAKASGLHTLDDILAALAK